MLKHPLLVFRPFHYPCLSVGARQGFCLVDRRFCGSASDIARAEKTRVSLEPTASECVLCSEAPFCPTWASPLKARFGGFFFGADRPSLGLRPVRPARLGVGFPVPQLAQAETVRPGRAARLRGPPAKSGSRF